MSVLQLKIQMELSLICAGIIGVFFLLLLKNEE